MQRARSSFLLPSVLFASICLFASGPARADDPGPTNCTVTGNISPDGVLVAPGPLLGTTLTVTARNALNNPVPHAIIHVLFLPAIRTCAGAEFAVTADENGVAVVPLRAGGCIQEVENACVVAVNGVIIRMFSNVKSPDNASHVTSAPDGVVTVADLAYFADEFLGAAPAGCHDYDNTGTCDLADMPYFGDAFKAQLRCVLE